MRIPSDEHITADLRSIKKENTAAGNIRFAADRGKNGHADRFWALALAIHAAMTMSGGSAWAESADLSARGSFKKYSGGIDYAAYR
jgi:phage FluMu gp28-like protein